MMANESWQMTSDPGSMRIGVLTSVEIRHRYFVKRLRAALPVVAVVHEQTGYTPASVDMSDLTPREARIVAEHFEERARQEELFFGSSVEAVTDHEACLVRTVQHSELNTDETVRFLESAGVNSVAVFGTNLIRSPLLDRWPGRMVNMHLGLSPYYRGTATNFYPLLNEEPQYVGATIHLLDAGIDSGPILGHARPTIVAEDMPHTIGCKAIIAGIEKMIAVLRDLDRGHIAPVPQWDVPNPRVYLRKDYHPRQVVDLYRKLDAGLIPRYVRRAKAVADRMRLVD
jgi:folate-dependent phosphoribosylglycinamide formyltransferase PurN